jgi:hypothetical protein
VSRNENSKVNPPENISALREVKLVLKEGEVVVNQFPTEFTIPTGS